MSTVLATLSEEKTTIRWREPYASDGLNRKVHGPIPRGVVRGGYLVAGGGALSVVIMADTETGDSVYTFSTADGRQVTVREVGNTTVSLNVGGILGTTVYIGLESAYVIGSDTVTEWRAYTEAEVKADDKIVVVGKVVVPGAGVIPAANVTGDWRRDAWQDTSVGMRDWRQLAEAGDMDVPAAGKAAGRPFPIWLATATGSATVEHSDTEKRSLTHSLRLGGTSGLVTIAPSAGDGANTVRYPVKAGMRLLYSFYAQENPPWIFDTTQQVSFLFYSALTSAAPASTVNKPFANPSMVAMWEQVTGVVDVPADGWMSWEIQSQADAANLGYLYIDDIRVWMESGKALEDQGQAYLMGVNRQITGSALTLLPVTPPDDVKTWADSAVRTFNTSPADGSAISLKTTADPVNGVARFDWTIQGSIYATSNSNHAIEGFADTDAFYAIYGHGGFAGLYGYNDGTGRTVSPIGALAFAENPNTGFPAIGLYAGGVGGAALNQPGIGVVGEGRGASARVGVFGVGAVVPAWPTVQGVGGVFWGDGASELYVADSLRAGVVGVASDRTGVVGLSATGNAIVGITDAIGADGIVGVTAATQASQGAGVKGWSTSTGAGVIGIGGGAVPAISSTTGVYGISVIGHGVEAWSTSGVALYAESNTNYGVYGRSRDASKAGVYGYSNAVGGLGMFAYSDAGTGIFADSAADYGIVARGVGGFGAGAFKNIDAHWDEQAIRLNSGIIFAEGDSEPESQNPDYDRALKNVLKAIGVPKLWAVIECTNASPTILDGMNVDPAVTIYAGGGSPYRLQVGLAEDMDAGNYCPLVTIREGVLAGPYFYQVVGLGTGGFSVAVYDKNGNQVDLDNSGIIINVMVMGRQPLDAY